MFAELPLLVDIIFALDGSDSMTDSQFEQLKSFVKKSVTEYDISQNGPHIGVIEYSDEASLKIRLSDFDKPVPLNAAISKIQRSAGRKTATDKVLRLAATEAFRTSAGSRANAHKVLFILTDDKSTGEEPVQEAVVAAVKEGIQVYVLGIGQNVNRGENEGIVSPHIDRYFTISTVVYLDTLVGTAKFKVVNDLKTGRAN